MTYQFMGQGYANRSQCKQILCWFDQPCRDVSEQWVCAACAHLATCTHCAVAVRKRYLFRAFLHEWAQNPSKDFIKSLTQFALNSFADPSTDQAFTLPDDASYDDSLRHPPDAAMRMLDVGVSATQPYVADFLGFDDDCDDVDELASFDENDPDIQEYMLYAAQSSDAPAPVTARAEAWLNSIYPQIVPVDDRPRQPQQQKEEQQQARTEHSYVTHQDDQKDIQAECRRYPTTAFPTVAGSRIQSGSDALWRPADGQAPHADTGDGPSFQESSARSVLAGAVRSRPLLATESSVATLPNQSAQPDVIGAESVMRALLSIINAALALPSAVSRVITLTWLQPKELLAPEHPLWNDWSRTIRRALNRGWAVRHLIQDTRDHHKTPRITEYMRHWVSAKGLYEPYLLFEEAGWRLAYERYIRHHTASVRNEFVTISGVGGFHIAFDGAQPVAWRIPAGKRIEAINRMLDQGFLPDGRVYREIYDVGAVSYLRAILNIELQPGAHYAFINGLSEATLPESVMTQRAQVLLERGMRAEGVTKIMELMRARHDAMERNLKQFKHVDVCPTSAITRFVRHGVYQDVDSWTARGVEPLTITQRYEHLFHLIHMLEEHTNYELILLDQDWEALGLPEFLVKAGYKAMLEFWVTDANGATVRKDMEIAEPSIVEALQDTQMWAEIKAHAITDQKEVVKILREQMALVC